MVKIKMPNPEGLWKIIVSPITARTAIRYGFLFVAIVFSIREILPLLKSIAPLTEQDLPGFSYTAHFALTILFSLIAGTLAFELSVWLYKQCGKLITERRLRKERARKRELSQMEIKRVREDFVSNFNMMFPNIDPRYKFILYELRGGNKGYSDLNSAVNYLRRQGWIHNVAELPHSQSLYRLDDNIRLALDEIKPLKSN